jgi:hypothetical protein
MKKIILMLIVGLVFMVVPAKAVSVFSDDFESGTANWYTVNDNGTMTITNPTDATIGTGKVLEMATVGNNKRRPQLANFAADTTVGVGESIALSFDFRLTSPLTNTASGFRFGLLNNGGTKVTANNAQDILTTDVAGNDPGFFGSLSTGTSLGFKVQKDKATASFIMANSDISTIGTANTTTQVINDLLKHSAKLIVAKSSPGGVATVTVEMWLDGTMIYTGTNAISPLQWTFNEVAFSANITDLSGTDFGYAIDNVVVDYTAIPEPATIALLALGFVALRKRK